MSKYKILFADLYGTLINTISGKPFPEGIWDMHLHFGTLAKIKELKPSFLFIVSNQGGIEKGFVDEYHFCAKLGFIVHSTEEYCNIYYLYASGADMDEVFADTLTNKFSTINAVVDGGDTRAQGQIEMQVNLVAHDRVGSNLHF